MTRRRVLLLGSVAVVVALVLAVMIRVLQSPPYAPVTQENIQKIVEDRLDRAQIEALIGPGDGDEKRRVWVGERIIVAIDFAPNGTFEKIRTQESPPESLLSRIRRLLHL